MPVELRAASRPLLSTPRAGSCSLGRLFGGVEEDVQEAAFVVGGVVGEVVLDVLDGFGQLEQPVPELVELLAGHDQLVLAEAELTGSAAGLVVALTAGTPAVQAGTPGAGCGLVRAATPPASRGRPD